MILRGYLPETTQEISNVFEGASEIFGRPEITEEFVVFYKYSGDIRVRLRATGLSVLKKKASLEQHQLSKSDEYSFSSLLEDALSVFRFLNHIGYEKGLISHTHRVSFSIPGKHLLITTNQRGIRYFEYHGEEDTGPDIQDAGDRVDLIRRLGLSPVAEEDVKSFNLALWKGVEPEPILDETDQLHPEIQNFLDLNVAAPRLGAGRRRPMSLLDKLQIKGNEYSHFEKAFSLASGRDLLSQEPISYRNKFACGASVIIPIKNSYTSLRLCLTSIAEQDLSASQFAQLQVIVCDDGSDLAGVEEIVGTLKGIIEDKGARFDFVRTYLNKGRPVARNIGADVATEDVLIFLDSDIVLHNRYVSESLIRHQYLDKLVLVGFKQNILLNDERVKSGSVFSELPDLQSDFRFGKDVHDDWVGLHPVKELRRYNCVEESNQFRDFGFGRTIGPFDLPCMLVTHNVSMSKAEFEKAGRFDPDFRHYWGFEDTFLGACLIANGNFIVPLFSSGVFHLEPVSEKETGLRRTKHDEMASNFQIYQDKISKLPE